jgi:hypothetical protein
MTEGPNPITQPIRIAQLNVQRKKQVMVQLLNECTTDFDILLIQEPAWGFIGRDPDTGSDVSNTVALRGWNTILPTSSTSNTSPRPRTLTYYKPREDITVTPRPDILEDRDGQALNVTQGHHQTVSLINIYNDTPRRDLSLLSCLQNTDFSFPANPTMITGDFNLHHPSWSREDRDPEPENNPADTTARWLARHGFSLLNTRGEITHLARHDGERPSVIDLSFINGPARMTDAIKDWSINPSFALDSDHNAITFTIDYGISVIEKPLDIKYNLNKTDPSKWMKAFESELSRKRETLMILQEPGEIANELLDLYADTITGTMQKAIVNSSPPRKPHPKSKPWWDKELTEATERIAAARKDHHEYQRTTGEFSTDLQNKIHKFRNSFKRLCKFKKKAWATKTLEAANAKMCGISPNGQGVLEATHLRPYPKAPMRPTPHLTKINAT